MIVAQCIAVATSGVLVVLGKLPFVALRGELQLDVRVRGARGAPRPVPPSVAGSEEERTAEGLRGDRGARQEPAHPRRVDQPADALRPRGWRALWERSPRRAQRRCVTLTAPSENDLLMYFHGLPLILTENSWPRYVELLLLSFPATMKSSMLLTPVRT